MKMETVFYTFPKEIIDKEEEFLYFSKISPGKFSSKNSSLFPAVTVVVFVYSIEKVRQSKIERF